jgi:hypothetical protein
VVERFLGFSSLPLFDECGFCVLLLVAVAYFVLEIFRFFLWSTTLFVLTGLPKQQERLSMGKIFVLRCFVLIFISPRYTLSRCNQFDRVTIVLVVELLQKVSTLGIIFLSVNIILEHFYFNYDWMRFPTY